MARQELANGDSGLSVRTKLNDMLREIYTDLVSGLTFLGILETGDSVTGSPSQGDFYIVENAATYGGIVCVQYDAIFYNGTGWEKLTGYGDGRLKETLARSSGAPATGDPLDLTIVTHDFTRTYSSAPTIILTKKCDWDIYLVSVSTTQVVIGVGGQGTSTEAEFDYEINVF